MKYPITKILLVFLAFSSFFHSAESTSCVSSFSTPLRISLCNSNLGTVSFTVLSNGKLQITVTLASGATSRIQSLRVFIGNNNPDSDPTSDKYTRVQGNTFTSSQTVCGKTLKVAVAVVLTDGDGASCTAWAVPDPSAGVPSGVSFTKFHNGGFSGFFTIHFCECGPTNCCNPSGFKFDCNAIQTCPLSDPFTDPGSGLTCYCGNIAGGGVACLADRGTCDGAKQCTSNGDCPADSACQVSSCCSGQSICVQLCQRKFPKAPTCTQPPITRACCNATRFNFDCNNLHFCPQSNPVAGNKCYCGKVEGNDVACLADRGTCDGAKTCNKNSDCPNDSFCQLGSCCSGQNICVQACQNKFSSAGGCQQPSKNW